jgi:uncharacterized protein (DUF111 family)
MLISETGTLGVRVRSSNRYVVPRVIISVPISIQEKNFTVRCKIVKHEEVVKHFKVESDDVKDIAKSLSLSFREASERISEEVRRRLNIK